MFAKILGLALLAAYVQAQGYKEQASSYISYSQNIGLGGSSSGNYGGLSGGLDSYGGALGSSSGGHEGSSYISYSQGGGSSLGHVQAESYHHAPAKYQFKYGVEDHHTGDIKSQEETRDGDVVKGSYSLHEPDGTILTVHYTADKHSGFNAVVHREGHASHPQYSSHH